MGRSRDEFKTPHEFEYFGRHHRLRHNFLKPCDNRAPSTLPVEPTSSTLCDIFGSLPQDIQIEVLGYIAVHSPAQIVSMRRVCKRWNEILSQDSIYHSALFTASFSIPSEISREVFEKTAFTDSRLRNFIFSKAKGLNCVASPKGLVYRDGFLVWWANNAFIFVDFNKTKPASKRHIIKPTNTFMRTPIYALGGGILVYMMRSEEAASISTGLRLHVVQLGEPLKRGDLDLSSFQDLTMPFELYCSSEYVLVLRGLEVLVGDIKVVTAMEAIRTIHLSEHTHLSFPVVNTIEISDNGRCLVILTSNGNVETLAFSLTTGSLFKRYSTNPLESRDQAHQSQTIYHVQNSQDFSKDIQYQVRNTTHKEHHSAPTGQSSNANTPHRYRWIKIPPIRGDEDECITGSYTSSSNQPFQHRVTFPRQGLSFSAFEDNDYNKTTVQWQCLKISRGHLGTEKVDSSTTGSDDIVYLNGSEANMNGKMSYCWTPPAKTWPPPECVVSDSEGGSVTRTDLWVQNRQQWGEAGILLGDEKALILVLPHHLVIWKFQRFEEWRDRRMHRVKYNIGNTIYLSVSVVLCVGVLLPILVVLSPCFLAARYSKKGKEKPVDPPVAQIHPRCHELLKKSTSS